MQVLVCFCFCFCYCFLCYAAFYSSNVSSHLFRSLCFFFAFFTLSTSCTSSHHHHVSSFLPGFPDVIPSSFFAVSHNTLLVSSHDLSFCSLIAATAFPQSYLYDPRRLASTIVSSLSFHSSSFSPAIWSLCRLPFCVVSLLLHPVVPCSPASFKTDSVCRWHNPPES